MAAPTPGARSGLEHALGIACALPLALIVVLTFVDVFARYVFAAPIRGSVELIEFSMALLIFAALPLVTRDRGHVTVSLVDGMVTGMLRRVVRVLCDLVSTLALALLAWRLWEQAGSDLAAGTRSIVLLLPNAPLSYALCGFAMLSAVWMAGLTWQGLRGHRGRP